MNTLKVMLIHRVEVLKRVSQIVHSIFTSLKSVEDTCNESLTWLTSIFNQWGPYIQFFDSLIILVTKKPEMLDKFS